MNISAISAYSAIAKTKTSSKPVSFGQVNMDSIKYQPFYKNSGLIVSSGDLTISGQNAHFTYYIVPEGGRPSTGVIKIENPNKETLATAIGPLKDGDPAKPQFSDKSCTIMINANVDNPISKPELLQDVKAIASDAVKKGVFSNLKSSENSPILDPERVLSDKSSYKTPASEYAYAAYSTVCKNGVVSRVPGSVPDGVLPSDILHNKTDKEKDFERKATPERGGSGSEEDEFVAHSDNYSRALAHDHKYPVFEKPSDDNGLDTIG